eukprot:3482009-Amphidinium_carterae.1
MERKTDKDRIYDEVFARDEREIAAELARSTDEKERAQMSRVQHILKILKADAKSGALQKRLQQPETEEEANKYLADREEKRVANMKKVSRELADAVKAAKEDLASGGTPQQKLVPPTSWGMRLQQWNGYVDACKETDEYKALKESRAAAKGCVNMYDLNKQWVIPQTAGTGASLALLLNRDQPLEAEVMISHAWGEDVEQCQQALVNVCMPEAKVVWFCVFANYQAGGDGDVGPDIGWQLSLSPFQQVINHPDLVAMVVIHTTVEEVYNRLWCVHEIDEAMLHK